MLIKGQIYHDKDDIELKNKDKSEFFLYGLILLFIIGIVLIASRIGLAFNNQKY